MKRLLLLVTIAALTLSACSVKGAVETPDALIRVEGLRNVQLAIWHDDQRNVTCYIVHRGKGKFGAALGIDCLTDTEIEVPE